MTVDVVPELEASSSLSDLKLYETFILRFIQRAVARLKSRGEQLEGVFSPKSTYSGTARS